MALTGEDKHGGLTMFHLPAGTPGVKIRGIETMRGREVNDVFLTGVRLPRTPWSVKCTAGGSS
ncbi:hypothetical protein [Streptomyces sp. NPDC093594]|uniref:hypothetical protein n=1 Tax=Streptomyces sp. NPDC093594 TaxID=3155305 RepID=UPI00344F433D